MNERSFIQGELMSTVGTQKGIQTRLVITQAAHDLFIKQGYHGTSMRQIAREANLALGSIYNHFSGKEAIFQAVFIANHPFLDMLPAIENAQGETIEDFVNDAANQMIDAIYGKPDFLNLMFIEIVEFNSAHVHKLFETTFPRGLKIVNRMKLSDGKLREIPTPMLIRAFISMFFSYYLADIILGNAAPPAFKENAMEYFVDIFLHGILK